MKNYANKKGFISLFVLTVLLLIARFFQLSVDIDTVTGGLKSSAVGGVIVPATLIVVIICAFIFYFISENSVVKSKPMHSIPLAVSSFLFGLMVVLEGVYAFIDAKNTFAATQNDNTCALIYKLSIISLVFSVIITVYFLLLSLTFLIEGVSSYPSPFFAFFMPIWCAVKLLMEYIILTNSPGLTEKIYNSLIMCAIAIFVMANIRMFSGTPRAMTGKSLTAFGLLTILLNIIFIIPRYIMIWFKDYIITDQPWISNLMFMAFAVYIFFLLIAIEKENLKKGNDDSGIDSEVDFEVNFSGNSGSDFNGNFGVDFNSGSGSVCDSQDLRLEED